MIYKLDDVCDFINGGAWSDKEYVSKGLPVLKVTNCKPNGFSVEDINYLPLSSATKYAKNKLRIGDVVIATVGSHPNLVDSAAGRSCIINSLVEGFYLNQNAVCMRTKDNDIVDQGYLGYHAKYRIFQHFIQMRGRGAANQMRIAIGSIKSYEFNFPNIDVQRKIASILSVYDNLIENNQKQIKLLEEAAQRLYKEWFVGFRFPGYEYTPIVDGVPEGWFKGILGDINCRLESGSRPKGGIDSTLKNGIPSIGAENVIGLGQYKYSSEKKVSTEFFEKMQKGKLVDRDILIYKDGAYIGKTSLFQDGFPHKTASVNEHVFLLHAENEELQYYLFFTLYQEEYFDKMQKLNKNSAQPGINQKNLLTLELMFPNKELISNFNELVTPIMSNIFAKAKQCHLLSQARDRLLPKLMNGEIEV
jgi:type I restriction enzyme S subunit